MAIIAMLFALIVPSVGRAREMARRAQCAANLRAIGGAAHAFAVDHNHYLPGAYRMPDSKYPFRFPVVINRNPNMENNPAYWQNYGTPWQTWTKYLVTDRVFNCPSADGGVKYLDVSVGCPPEWGSIVWTDYVYLGGLTSTNCGKSIPKWGTAVPAVTERDPQLGERYLAADLVFFSGGPGFQWNEANKPYRINHARAASGKMPDYQNILYGDGHVDGKGREWFPSALNATNNFSLANAPAPVGGFLYWAPKKAGTPYVPPVLVKPAAGAPVIPTKVSPPPLSTPKSSGSGSGSGSGSSGSSSSSSGSGSTTTSTPPPPPPPPTTPAPTPAPVLPKPIPG